MALDFQSKVEVRLVNGANELSVYSGYPKGEEFYKTINRFINLDEPRDMTIYPEFEENGAGYEPIIVLAVAGPDAKSVTKEKLPNVVTYKEGRTVSCGLFVSPDKDKLEWVKNYMARELGGRLYKEGAIHFTFDEKALANRGLRTLTASVDVYCNRPPVPDEHRGIITVDYRTGEATLWNSTTGEKIK